MRLIDEIIELAVDDKTSLSVLLRKCLVLAHRLRNEPLKSWVEKELDGYNADDLLPDYRQSRPISKGVFFGPFGSKIENQPIPTVMLKEEHRQLVENADFRSPVAAYDIDRKEVGFWIIPWSPNLVGMYQARFYEGTYALASAWQEVPQSFVTSLLDTIRNRVLRFALQIQDQFGSADSDPTALTSERIEQSVVNIFYGGNNIVAAQIRDINQADNLVVVKGSFESLSKVLKQFGTEQSDIQALKCAIDDDKSSPAGSALGHKTVDWVRNVAVKIASKSGGIGLDIAKAEITAEFTKLISRYVGLT